MEINPQHHGYPGNPKTRQIHMHTPCMLKLVRKPCIQLDTCNQISFYSLILMSTCIFLLLLCLLASITNYPHSPRAIQEKSKYPIVWEGERSMRELQNALPKRYQQIPRSLFIEEAYIFFIFLLTCNLWHFTSPFS